MSTETYVLIGIAVGLAVLLFLRSRGRISGGEAKRLLEQGATLVDVRTPGEFASGHLAGATNIPLGELSRRADELGPKDRDVVLYCASGMRSRSAQGMLRARGYLKVHDLGGMHRFG